MWWLQALQPPSQWDRSWVCRVKAPDSPSHTAVSGHCALSRQVSGPHSVPLPLGVRFFIAAPRPRASSWLWCTPHGPRATHDCQATHDHRATTAAGHMTAGLQRPFLSLKNTFVLILERKERERKKHGCRSISCFLHASYGGPTPQPAHVLTGTKPATSWYGCQCSASQAEAIPFGHSLKPPSLGQTAECGPRTCPAQAVSCLREQAVAGALCVPQFPPAPDPGYDTTHKPCPLLPHGTPDIFCTWEPQESTHIQSTMDFLPEALTLWREELANPHQHASLEAQSGRQTARCSGTGRWLITQTEGGA